jgi:hypothetical protein
VKLLLIRLKTGTLSFNIRFKVRSMCQIQHVPNSEEVAASASLSEALQAATN